MRKIRIKDDFMWQSDCAVIVQVFSDRGYEINEQEARQMWEMNSNSVCASWLNLPSNDEHIWQELLLFWEEIDNDS